MVCLDVHLFGDQEADYITEIALVGSLEVQKYDSERIEKMLVTGKRMPRSSHWFERGLSPASAE